MKLAIGLIISGNQIDRLSRDSEQLLQQAIGTSQAARAISDRVTGLERAARQYRVLRDAEALANLGQQREILRERIQYLNQSIENEALGDVLGDIQRQESELIRRLYAETPSTEWTMTLADGFAELAQSVNRMSAEVAAVVEQSADRLEQLGRQARANAWIQLGLILPFAVLLAIVFTRMINRPIQQLDRGIRALMQPDAGPIPQVESPRDLRALSLRLEWVRRRLLRVEKDRQRLLGQASHELKTPLSALNEGVSLLHDELLGPLQEPQMEVIEIMQRNVQQLQAQIDTLLRYNRARAELKARAHEPVCVAELVEQAIDSHRLSMTARSIQLEVEVEAAARVKGDIDLLLTAFDNLISNAVKYSPASARLGLFVSVEDQRVLIDVADQGPGIENSDRERIFDPFFRARQPNKAEVAGSGLGLAICRDLIRAHGGDVALIQSKPAENHWTTIVRITLPFWQAEPTI
ncbi:MAG: HAMP domain-containing sensor histidine kinase [Pseudomonadota bacterium]